MRKFTGKIKSISAVLCATLALSASITSGFFAPFLHENVTANAQSATLPDATLIAPSSYEQYLSLSSPSHVAVTNGYTAIADENNVYVFDRAAGVYRQYEHSAKVTRLQFDSVNKLYFLDASTRLYTLNPSSLELTETGFVCSKFLIHGTDLYFTNTTDTSQIGKTSLHDLNGSATILKGLDRLSSAPDLAFYNGELYLTTWNGIISDLFKFNPTTNILSDSLATFPSELLSMAIEDNVFTCVLRNGDFRVYNLNDFTPNATQTYEPYFHTTGNYSAVSVHDKHIYAIENQVIRQYSLETHAFTDYEISAASASDNRLHTATEVCLADETLFIADNGNQRISVYDTKTNTFLAAFKTDLAPTYLASDGETLLAANAQSAVLFDLSADNYGETLSSYATFNGNVQGVASVYGSYYFVTDKNQFLSLTEQENGWKIKTTQKSETKLPTLLSADPYGKLYVACGNAVYAYTETEFLSPTSGGKEITTQLPNQTQKLSFDYRGNFYALQGDRIHRYTLQTGNYEQTATFDTDQSYVYGATPQAISFALSLKDNQAYVLYANDYLICRNDFALPTLKNIAVDGADDRIFTNESIPFAAVTVQVGALMVEFDFRTLQNAEYFSYLSHEWKTENVTALKIGEVDVYDILAVFDETRKTYRTYLVYTSSCNPLSAEEYQTMYSQEEQKTAYLTNAISLYKVPYLNAQLTVCPLVRGDEITLLGEITQLDRAYYYVSFTDSEGNVQTGYVPQSYVTPTGNNVQPQTTPVGDATSDVASIGRMIYLVISFGAICILVDYLILRKPKDEREDSANFPSNKA